MSLVFSSFATLHLQENEDRPKLQFANLNEIFMFLLNIARNWCNILIIIYIEKWKPWAEEKE